MASQAQPKELSRVEVREILKRHSGSFREIAKGLDPPVSDTAVWLYLNGKSKSARIAAACLAKARTLLELEAQKSDELKRTA